MSSVKSPVVALIPAKSRSTGIEGKNFRLLGGKPLWQHAADCAKQAMRLQGVQGRVVLSSDTEIIEWPHQYRADEGLQPFIRPAELCQDDTPMFDVVVHAVQQLQLSEDTIILLLQPNAVFRKPAYLQAALACLSATGADSVVSVVELPKTHHPDFQLEIDKGELWVWPLPNFEDENYVLPDDLGMPSRRQDVGQTYIRDGTVYAFPVRTLAGGSIYGEHVRPLIIPAADSCELDTIEHWADVERRWHAKHETDYWPHRS